MDNREDRQRDRNPALVLGRGDVQIPAVILLAGGVARFAFEEFFQGQIRNPYTRKAYLHSVRLFSDWCQGRALELIRVTPADVARFLDTLPVASPTRKLHLAALRRFFDTLVLRHVLILNPALSVRSERYQVVGGKTPEISIEHARRLLRSIDSSHVVGLRDFVVVAILIYTVARVGAVARLRRRDFYESGDQSCLRFHEKGGKVREIPVRHDLQQALERYLDSSGLRYGEPNSPLFRSAVRRTRRLNQNGMTVAYGGLCRKTQGPGNRLVELPPCRRKSLPHNKKALRRSRRRASCSRQWRITDLNR